MSFIHMIELENYPELDELKALFVIPVTMRKIVATQERVEWTIEDIRRHPLAMFSLSYLPGNGCIAVSHDLWITAQQRERGIATALRKFKDWVCYEAGIKLVMCTVNSDNTAQLKIMKKDGWDQCAKYEDRNRSIIVYVKVPKNPFKELRP